ncbi:MAG: ArsR family transcriptional regulator [Dehalococcoidia bacterium]|nr:ArsR family transcriptional regulator [Dehalococcoidia bacterium]
MTTTGGARVEGTREAILDILRRRRVVSVAEFARELGLAGATVRRHLDVLLRDRYVAVTQVRGYIGRPRYAFSLTELGAELFPHHYVRLTHRLLDEIVALQAGEMAGRDGAAVAGLVFDKMAERLAREYGPRVAGTALQERARSAADLLAGEGLGFELEVDGGGDVLLLGRGCPCLRFSREGHAFSCDHDRRLLERVIGAEVVALPRAELPGDFLCGYRVSRSAAESAPPAPRAG